MSVFNLALFRNYLKSHNYNSKNHKHKACRTVQCLWFRFIGKFCGDPYPEQCKDHAEHKHRHIRLSTDPLLPVSAPGQPPVRPKSRKSWWKGNKFRWVSLFTLPFRPLLPSKGNGFWQFSLFSLPFGLLSCFKGNEFRWVPPFTLPFILTNLLIKYTLLTGSKSHPSTMFTWESRCSYP